MKQTKHLLLLYFAVLTFAACKKDKTERPTIVGFWVGKYGGTSTYPGNGYAFLLRKDGTMRAFDGADTTTMSDNTKAVGTYTISGSNFTATYKYILSGGNIISVAAEIDGKFTFLEGTWGTGTSSTGGGRFFLNKK